MAFHLFWRNPAVVFQQFSRKFAELLYGLWTVRRNVSCSTAALWRRIRCICTGHDEFWLLSSSINRIFIIIFGRWWRQDGAGGLLKMDILERRILAEKPTEAPLLTSLAWMAWGGYLLPLSCFLFPSSSCSLLCFGSTALAAPIFLSHITCYHTASTFWWRSLGGATDSKELFQCLPIISHTWLINDKWWGISG